MSKPKPPYDVGYGKPPKSGQFVTGQSGNSKGRPKGSKNLSTVVMRECRQQVRINGPGGTRTVTKLEATVMQLTNAAAQGKLPFVRELLALAQSSEERTKSGASSAPTREDDQHVMKTILERAKKDAAQATATDNNVSPEESQ